MIIGPRSLSWRQLTFYSPDNRHTQHEAANGSSKSPSMNFPGIADVLSSRRLRLWLPFTAACLVILGLHQRREELFGFWEAKNRETGTAVNTTPDVPGAADPSTIDWSRFAYTQYVTNSEYLCNSVMLFERLHHLGSRADRVMMYPSYMLDPNAADPGTSDDARLLIKARDEYNARLVPITVQSREGEDRTWAESFTKLLAFNQTQYERVLSLDSDSVVLQPMDELFLLPPCPMAMPRAYWLYPDTKILSSQIMLLQPSAAEFARVMDKVGEAARNDYDMEIVNYLYQDSALVLPHRRYDLLVQEYREEPDKHAYYLGTDREEWDPVAVFNEAKFLHFSDWPVPKPWRHMPESTRSKMEPRCYVRNGVESCAERDLWNGFYTEFVERRKRVCGTAGAAGKPSRVKG